jgi:hypothetical protein
MVYIEQAGQAYAHAEVAARSLRRDPVFRFAHFLQPTEDRGCTVGSFAETTAYHRSKDIGGFPTTATTDRGLFTRRLVFLAAGD